MIQCPFTILIDSREQLPYAFQGFKADAVHQFKPLRIVWEWASLESGDYSIEGFEHAVCIERKSLSDLFNSCGQNRERFEREHQRMAELEFAAVVVEADWHTVLKEPPDYSRLRAKCVYRTALSWSQRYGVHWIMCGSRPLSALEAAEKLGLLHPAMYYTEVQGVLENHRGRIRVVADEHRAQSSRRLAEITTFRLLEKFWNEKTRA